MQIDITSTIETKASNHDILDSDSHYYKLDLIQHLPKNNFIKRFAMQTAQQCDLPESTVFLNLMGIFSSVACRKWKVGYENGGSLPIGIYAICEQPPASGKTRCQNIGQSPFFERKKELQKFFKQRMNELDKDDLSAEEEAELERLNAQKASVFSRAFVTNATAEGLERTLLATDGYFSAVSSEQGMLNSLLGLSYGTQQNNNDILLSGFDAGYVSSCRVARDGFHGHAIGGVILFAQQGSVEKVLSASNGTGLAERFLLLVEPHRLGLRDHFKHVHIDDSLALEYASRCSFSADVYRSPMSFEDLMTLRLSDAGYRLVKEFQQELEPHLADGALFSSLALRGAAGKANMQVLKLAANLHLLCRDDAYSSIIPDDLVKASINMVRDLLNSSLAICKAKGLIGTKAEFEAILRMFEKDRHPKTERQIIQSRSKVEPFADYTGSKSKLIRDTLAEMVRMGIFARQGENGTEYHLIQ